MKKNVNILWILLGCVLLTFFGCTKGFIEANTNPNISEKALPQSLLAPAITKAVKFNLGITQTINGELVQVHTDGTSVAFRVFRYQLADNLPTAPYNNWFLQVANFRDVYAQAGERLIINTQETYNQTYQGIALIMEAWLISLITDTFGDIPYFDAGKAKEQIFLPAFDEQSAIYADLFAKLEEANELLKGGYDLPAELSFSDPVYHGDALAWRKFGNSLYLRLLMRVSSVEGAGASSRINRIAVAESADYPLIVSPGESAVLRWTGSIPYDSPYDPSNTTDFYWTRFKLTEFFLDNLLEWNDPRIEKWATRVGGEYVGVPGGYPLGFEPGAASILHRTLQRETLTGNIMNHSEVQFILAEAAAKGYISASDVQFYQAGIASNMEMWGVEMPEGYLEQPAVAFDAGASLEEKMEKIHLQKYYALLLTDLQQWFEIRRTGYPVLPVGAGHENNGIMPSRLAYPTYLYNTNRENLDVAIGRQGPDDINTKVWWQR